MLEQHTSAASRPGLQRFGEWVGSSLFRLLARRRRGEREAQGRCDVLDRLRRDERAMPRSLGDGPGDAIRVYAGTLEVRSGLRAPGTRSVVDGGVPVCAGLPAAGAQPVQRASLKRRWVVESPVDKPVESRCIKAAAWA